MIKKICWVTPDCFVDVDYNSGIIEEILKFFDIYAIVVLTRNGRFKESDFDTIKRKHSNLNLSFVYLKHRARDIRTLADYYKIYRMVKAAKADVNYINVVPENPLSLPFYMLPKSKTIYTAHDGYVKSISKFSIIVKATFSTYYRLVKNVNMFSKTESFFFQRTFPDKKLFIIPLAMKDYGQPTIDKRKDCISFVSFGTLHDEKNIGLLIEAANQLYEEGTKNFKVSINGGWAVDWSIHDKIRHEEIFELNLKMIPNDDIPNIFGYNHYAVYPYKMMSQSGALKVAFNYFNPVIVSNLKGFTDEVEDGIDGYVFESENIESLKNVMKKCIQNGEKGYVDIVLKMKKHIQNTYSIDVISEKYLHMFNKVINS